MHEAAPDMQKRLGEIINDERGDGGRILIPAFSVGRTQNIVWFLGNLIADGTIPEMPIFVDSPLSTKATKILASYPELFDQETRDVLAAGRRPFFFDGVRYTASVEESKTLNGVRSGIIISASGMCESGRIVHHLKQTLGRKEDCLSAFKECLACYEVRAVRCLGDGGRGAVDHKCHCAGYAAFACS